MNRRQEISAVSPSSLGLSAEVSKVVSSRGICSFNSKDSEIAHWREEVSRATSLQFLLGEEQFCLPTKVRNFTSSKDQEPHWTSTSCWTTEQLKLSWLIHKLSTFCVYVDRLRFWSVSSTFQSFTSFNTVLYKLSHGPLYRSAISKVS